MQLKPVGSAPRSKQNDSNSSSLIIIGSWVGVIRHANLLWWSGFSWFWGLTGFFAGKVEALTGTGALSFAYRLHHDFYGGLKWLLRLVLCSWMQRSGRRGP